MEEYLYSGGTTKDSFLDTSKEDLSLIYSPIKVCVYDPIKKMNKRIFCFLGDVPKSVSNAVISYHASKGLQRQQFERVLKEFYGPNFKEKLAMAGDYTTAYLENIDEQSSVSGSQETSDENNPLRDEYRTFTASEMAELFSNVDVNDNVNDDTVITQEIIGSSEDDDVDFSDIEDLLQEPVSKGEQKAKPSVTETESSLRAEFEAGVEYITQVHIYPEDKYSEVKEKIYLASNIPVYRQHLFYMDKGRVNTTYKVYAEGLYNVDIRRLFESRDNILGTPIDKFLYDVRDEVRIEALDQFKIIGESQHDKLSNVLFVTDLAQFTYRNQSQLVELVNDTYQFELYYYGFVIKYWPQLTQECFYDYITSEPELQYKYPDLAKSKSIIQSVHKMEKEIVDYNYRILSKTEKWIKSTNVNIAITQMTATVVGSKSIVNIRNLFDKLRVTRCIPEIHAYVEHNNKKFLLRKRHVKNGSDIQFPSGVMMKNGLTMAISLRKSDQDTFHQKTTMSTMENEQSRYLFLNIQPNGRYFVRTVWNEEDELGFDDILKIMKRFADPIIGGINNLGRYALPQGDQLPIINRSNISYQSLNICVFWKKIILESAFKVLKSFWEPYLRAGITGPRNVQQFNLYEFVFRKGMHEFDTSAIEKIVNASNNIILRNYYAHLSNSAIKQKWDQTYEGRIVRMSHRTTDVKFEVLNIRESEFQLFYRYILVFIAKAMCDVRIKSVGKGDKAGKDVKKLKKLREQDPELYNLKKYGSIKVYSILCQNQRQPLIYTDEELKNLPKYELKKLTKYWNFTLNKEAYYGCPNKKYPHLSFIVNAHPKHYCLPCCKKSLSTEESKKTKVNSVCLSKHKFTVSAEGEGGVSRHIMNYGKDIDVGRLSKLPNASLKALLMNTMVGEESGYYLFGVAQHFPYVKNMGIVYSVAEALSMEAGDLMKNLVQEMNKLMQRSASTANNLFNTLLNGTLIEYFSSMKELVSTIKEAFIDLKMFPYERGLASFNQWSELFVELFHHFHNVNVFTFVDENGKGEVVDMFVPNYLRSEILYINQIAERSSKGAQRKTDTMQENKGNVDNVVDIMTSMQKYVMVVRKTNKYYPLFAINSEKYFKSLQVDQRIFKYNDSVVKLLYQMVLHDEKEHNSGLYNLPNLAIIKEFTGKQGYSMQIKYVNKRNLCYAVLLSLSSSDEKVYVPIDYSIYVPDNVPIQFEAFNSDETKVSLKQTVEFIKQFNSFIQENYTVSGGDTREIYQYNKIVVEEFLKSNDSVFGFTTKDGLSYYFTNVDESTAHSILPDVPIKNVKYNYNEVNDLILKRAEPEEDKLTLHLGESLYNNYIYQLFVIEFINYLEKERNDDIRGRIKQLIQESDFKKEFSGFRKELTKLLKEFPSDYNVLQSQLMTFYYTHFNKHTLIQLIDNTVYDFDHVTINRLRTLPDDQLKTELFKFSKTFSVHKEFDTTKIQFPNIYLPCSDMVSSHRLQSQTELGYCDGNKLIVNRDLDEMIDILAKDIKDDLKSKYLMDSLFTDNTIDYLKFDQYPTEVITIYKLSE